MGRTRFLAGNHDLAFAAFLQLAQAERGEAMSNSYRSGTLMYPMGEPAVFSDEQQMVIAEAIVRNLTHMWRYFWHRMKSVQSTVFEEPSPVRIPPSDGVPHGCFAYMVRVCIDATWEVTDEVFKELCAVAGDETSITAQGNYSR